MYVCLCKAITDKRVRQLGESGVTAAEELIEVLGLEDEECCGFCKEHIVRMVAIARGGDPMIYGRFQLDPNMRWDFDNPDNAP